MATTTTISTMAATTATTTTTDSTTTNDDYYQYITKGLKYSRWFVTCSSRFENLVVGSTMWWSVQKLSVQFESFAYGSKVV